jgi:preprotein translocase subunit YajC
VKVVEGIKFSKAKIDKVNDKYIFYVTVTTSKSDSVNVQEFDATIYDKKGERIETLTGYIGDIDKNSKKEITIEANEDLSKAYEINYTVRFNND